MYTLGAAVSANRTGRNSSSFHPSSRPKLLQSPKPPLVKQDWWTEANFATIEGISGDAPFQLVAARVVSRQHSADLQGEASLPADAQDVYEEMGMCKPGESYTVVWIHLADASLVLLATLKPGLTSPCMLEGYLMRRMQLMVNCLGLPVPWPWSGEQRMNTLFRRKLTNCTSGSSSTGVGHTCLEIDLSLSRWQSKVLETVGLRRGNIVELVLVDGTSNEPLTACRLTVTEDLLQLLKRS